MVSARPGGCGTEDLFVSRRISKRDDFGWSAPVNLGCTVNSEFNDYTPTLFEDATGHTILYFGSNRPGGSGDSDIYTSTLDSWGYFGFPVLVPELSTPFNDERPNIRKDGLEIFFNSNRPSGSGGADLWVSKRERTMDAWSLPVNLGSIVNTPSNEMRPSLSFDGATLYFNSSRPGGFGGSDIYVMTRSRIHGRQ
jgi:Tol biopolymer transport system component